MEPLTPPASLRPFPMRSHPRSTSSVSAAGGAPAPVFLPTDQDTLVDPVLPPSRGRPRTRRLAAPTLALSLAQHVTVAPRPRLLAPLRICPPSPRHPRASEDDMLFPMSPVIAQPAQLAAEGPMHAAKSQGLNMKSLAAIWKGYDRFNARGRPRPRGRMRTRARMATGATGQALFKDAYQAHSPAPPCSPTPPPPGLPIRREPPHTVNSDKQLEERVHSSYSRASPLSRSPSDVFLYSFPVFESAMLEKARRWRARRLGADLATNERQSSDIKPGSISLLSAQLREHSLVQDQSTPDNSDSGGDGDSAHGAALLCSAFRSASLDDDADDGSSTSSSARGGGGLSHSLLSAFPLRLPQAPYPPTSRVSRHELTGSGADARGRGIFVPGAPCRRTRDKTPAPARWNGGADEEDDDAESDAEDKELAARPFWYDEDRRVGAQRAERGRSIFGVP